MPWYMEWYVWAVVLSMLFPFVRAKSRMSLYAAYNQRGLAALVIFYVLNALLALPIGLGVLYLFHIFTDAK